MITALFAWLWLSLALALFAGAFITVGKGRR